MAGNPEALIAWYNDGADGQIDWGSPGDFEQCVAIAGQHVDDPEGFCQLRHIDATGEPAGRGAHQGAAVNEHTDTIIDDLSPAWYERLTDWVAVNRPGSTVLMAAASDSSKPYGDVAYADPGYQKDGKKRYPLDTADHVRAAWSYINQGDNAGQYTAGQVAQIKGRIRSAGTKLGIKFADTPASKAAAADEVRVSGTRVRFADGQVIEVDAAIDEIVELDAQGEPMVAAAGSPMSPAQMTAMLNDHEQRICDCEDGMAQQASAEAEMVARRAAAMGDDDVVLPA